MKNKKFTIEEEIQRTLACIDKIDRVSVNPWLPTRLLFTNFAVRYGKIC